MFGRTWIAQEAGEIDGTATTRINIFPYASYINVKDNICLHGNILKQIFTFLRYVLFYILH